MDFVQAVAAKGQPEATFQAMARLVQDSVGAKLFTTMIIDREKAVARRNFTNMPDAYPVSGEKPIQRNRWTEIVEDQHKTFVANSIEAIAEVFPDWELIQSLGCESCMNVPVIIGGTLVGTLNCLHEAGHYTDDKVAAAETLKLPGALAFLIDQKHRKGA